MKYLFCTLLLCILGSVSARPTTHFHPASDPQIRIVGRTTPTSDNGISFDWSGTYITFRFTGTRCAIRVADTGRNYYNLTIDGQKLDTLTVTGSEPTTILLAQGLKRGSHTVHLQKRTEAEQGRTTLYGVECDGELLSSPAAPGRHIEFIGDSHTCGYGTEGRSKAEPFRPETENCNLAWGCICARYFDADYTLIAHSGQGIARNWGDPNPGSECTMRERMLRTFDMDPDSRWNFKGYTPDVVVINLGSNDFGTTPYPTQEIFTKAYTQTIRQLREAYGAVPILCVAPRLHPLIWEYIQDFCTAQNDPNLFCTALHPPINNADSDMGANYHPNYNGQRKMAMALIPYIATITGWELPVKVVE